MTSVKNATKFFKKIISDRSKLYEKVAPANDITDLSTGAVNETRLKKLKPPKTGRSGRRSGRKSRRNSGTKRGTGRSGKKIRIRRSTVSEKKLKKKRSKSRLDGIIAELSARNLELKEEYKKKETEINLEIKKMDEFIQKINIELISKDKDIDYKNNVMSNLSKIIIKLREELKETYRLLEQNKKWTDISVRKASERAKELEYMTRDYDRQLDELNEVKSRLEQCEENYDKLSSVPVDISNWGKKKKKSRRRRRRRRKSRKKCVKCHCRKKRCTRKHCKKTRCTRKR